MSKRRMSSAFSTTWTRIRRWSPTNAKASQRATYNLYKKCTVDGKTPAPVEMANVTGFIRIYTFQVVQDFFHQQYHKNYIKVVSLPWKHALQHAYRISWSLLVTITSNASFLLQSIIKFIGCGSFLRLDLCVSLSSFPINLSFSEPCWNWRKEPWEISVDVTYIHLIFIVN